MKRKFPNNLTMACYSPKIMILAALLVSLSVGASFMPVLAQSSKPSFMSKWIVKDRLAWVSVSINGRITDFHVTVNVARTATYVNSELRTHVKVTLEKIDPLSLSYTQLRIDSSDGSWIDLEWVNGPSSNPKLILTIRFHIAPGFMQLFVELFVALIGVAAITETDPLVKIMLQWFAGVVDQTIEAAKEDRNFDGSWDIWVPIVQDQLPLILIATPNWWWRITSAGRKQQEDRRSPPPKPPNPVVYVAYIKTVTRTHVRYNVKSWLVQKGAVFHKVTVYYINGGSEVFHWVVSYRFEPQPPLVPIPLVTPSSHIQTTIA